GLTPLPDEQIGIGKFTGDPAEVVTPITKVHPVFKDNCPLWTYVLAETVESNVAVKTTKGDRKHNPQARPGRKADRRGDVRGYPPRRQHLVPRAEPARDTDPRSQRSLRAPGAHQDRVGQLNRCRALRRQRGPSSPVPPRPAPKSSDSGTRQRSDRSP